MTLWLVKCSLPISTKKNGVWYAALSSPHPAERKAGSLRTCHPCFKSQSQETPCPSPVSCLIFPALLFIAVYLTVLTSAAIPGHHSSCLYNVYAVGSTLPIEHNSRLPPGGVRCRCSAQFLPGWTTPGFFIRAACLTQWETVPNSLKLDIAYRSLIRLPCSTCPCWREVNYSQNVFGQVWKVWVSVSSSVKWRQEHLHSRVLERQCL